MTVACSCSVCLVLMYVDILGLIYIGVGARTVEPWVLGCNILLYVSICRTWTWFLFVVSCIHSVWVLVTDVGMLGLILVRVG